MVTANIGTDRGITEAVAGLRETAEREDRPIGMLVHCAGAVGRLGPVTQITSADLETAFTLHAKAPLLLTTGLLDVLAPGARVLSLSTRAAHATFPGIGIYAAAKHAQHSVTTSLRLELAPEVLVASLIPGEVDTGMQADLRAPDPGLFELAAFFRENEGNLIPVDIAVDFVAWVLTGTPDDEFSREDDWYIYDASHHARWVREGHAFDYPEP